MTSFMWLYRLGTVISEVFLAIHTAHQAFAPFISHSNLDRNLCNSLLMGSHWHFMVLVPLAATALLHGQPIRVIGLFFSIWVKTKMRPQGSLCVWLCNQPWVHVVDFNDSWSNDAGKAMSIELEIRVVIFYTEYIK